MPANSDDNTLPSSTAATIEGKLSGIQRLAGDGVLECVLEIGQRSGNDAHVHSVEQATESRTPAGGNGCSLSLPHLDSDSWVLGFELSFGCASSCVCRGAWNQIIPPPPPPPPPHPRPPPPHPPASPQQTPPPHPPQPPPTPPPTPHSPPLPPPPPPGSGRWVGAPPPPPPPHPPPPPRAPHPPPPPPPPPPPSPTGHPGAAGICAGFITPPSLSSESTPLGNPPIQGVVVNVCSVSFLPWARALLINRWPARFSINFNTDKCYGSRDSTERAGRRRPAGSG